jgi:hypothetical protein
MIFQRLFLFAFILLATTINPVSSSAAVDTHESLHNSSHNMDMTDHGSSGHSMDETVNPGMHNMPEHTMDIPSDTRSTSDSPSEHNMDEMAETEAPSTPGHAGEITGDDPAHGGQAGNASGAGSLNTEVNRAGMLGGFGLLNVLIIMSAVFLKKKAAPVEGGGRHEK